MKLRINIYTALSAIFSIITLTAFWFFSKVFGETLIFYLGVPFSLGTFFFFLQLLRPSGRKAVFTFRTSTFDRILYLFTVISIVAVLFVPPYTGSMLEWMKIPAINWFRFFSSMLLTTFLSGYFLLKILDRKNSISGTASIVLSYLLSIFITFLTSFSILLTNNSILSNAPQAILAVNLLLMPVHYLINAGRQKKKNLSINLNDTLLLFSILLTVTISSLIVMCHNFPLTPGDMWRHHGLAIQYSDRGLVLGHRLIPSYPYLFNLYLAALFSISGIPSAITEQSLYILSFMPVLAFYSGVKAWFNRDQDKRISTIALTFSILLGFGGIYALHLKFIDPTYNIIPLLRETSSKTYDISMRFLYLPDIVAPIWNVGLPVFFTLLYFLKRNTEKMTRALIIPLIVAVGYLGHAPEVIFFVIVLFIYTMFSRQEPKAKMGLQVALGLLIVSTLDLIAPTQIYVLSDVGATLSLPFISSIIVATLTYIIEVVKGRHPMEVLKKLKMKIFVSFEGFWGYARWILLYSYLFLLIIWLTVVDNFNLWTWGGSTFTHFFVLPIRLGPVGLLAIISIFAYLPSLRKDRNLLFFLSWIPLGFILEQVANYYHSILPYASYRYGTLTFIGGCLITSYGVVKTLSRGRANLRFSPIKRKIMVCVLLNALLTSGFLTTTLYYINASIYHKGSELSEDELNAVNYIRQHLPKNASILTFTSQSAQRLRDLGGINAVQDAQRWSNLLLSTTNPYVITYILSLSNVKYIYVAQRDVELMNSNNVLSSLLEYFPNVFENEYVTLYEVPPLTPPSSQASLGILHFPPSLQNLTDTMWIDDTFLRDWVLYGKHGNIHDWSAHSDGDVLKINVTSNQSGTVWISYSLPLTLKTKNSILSFRYKVNNDFTWLTIILQNASQRFFFYKEHLTDKTFTTKSYLIPGDQNVTRVEIIVETSDKAPPRTSAIAEIDYIEISPSPFSKGDVFPSLFASLLHSKCSVLYVDALLMEKLGTYISNYTNMMLTTDPPILIEPLLKWTSAGNTLTVLNTDGNGFFAKLLELNNSSPLLSIKELGSGKIVYINCFSTIKTGNESELLQRDFLEKVKEVLALDEYVHRVNILPVYNSTFGSIKINGDLNILTDIIRLQGSVNLTNSPFPFNKSAEIDIYGKVNLTIQNASLLVLPSESYMLIKPERYPVEGEVRVDSSEALIVADANVIYNHDMPISFKFKTTDLSLYARLPAINALGTITFDQLDVHVALYVPLAGIVQQRAEIQGNVKFDTMYISNQLTMFSMFQADGKILNLAEATSRPTIPWAQVLTSPYNLALNTIFLSGIAIYTIKKRKAKTT